MGPVLMGALVSRLKQNTYLCMYTYTCICLSLTLLSILYMYIEKKVYRNIYIERVREIYIYVYRKKGKGNIY